MSDWISANDKLPKIDGTPVLIVSEGEVFRAVPCITWRDPDDLNECAEWRDGEYADVTHWMPIPELPGKETTGHYENDDPKCSDENKKAYENVVYGYKAFNSDWTCINDFQYEVGKRYWHPGNIELCQSGFHFCKNIINCFEIYPFTESTKIARVAARGPMKSDSKKTVTSDIEILEEIGWNEALMLCNIGDYNMGYKNTGSYNIGDYNTGDRNIGHWNSGSSNIGNCNSGDFNEGRFNTGDWNTGNYNVGIFCENKYPYIKMFDKDTNWTIEDWQGSHACYILKTSPSPTITVNNFNDEYSRLPLDELTRLTQKWWDNLSVEEHSIIRSLPNFNKEKFERIMHGINISIEDED